MAAGGTSDWNTVPSLHIRCRIDPTIARFVPLRFATCAAQLLSHDERPRFIMTVAAWQSALRRFASPARVMLPDTSRSPDWLRDGVRPTQGPNFFRCREPRRVIDGGSESQADDSADTGHRHQEAADGVFLRNQPDLSLKASKFVAQAGSRPEHGRC